MNRLLALSIIFAANAVGSAPNWTPDAATISKLESSMKPGDIPKWGASAQYPSGHSPVVADYARYYVGYTANRHRMIRGELIVPMYPSIKPVGIYVVGSEKNIPVVLDGGCFAVQVVYAVETANIVSLRCSGGFAKTN
jgi:hypothetical protein